MRTMMVLAALAAGLGSAAQAQETIYWSAPAQADHGRYSYFPMGTPLMLATRTELSTRNDHAGDRFELTVTQPLVYRDQVVVPAGALAVGEIARVERSAPAGKRGELAVRLLYVQTPSGTIRLSGKAERAGLNQQVLAIGGATFVAWPMIFIHGTSARLPADTAITGYLADDLRFPVAAATPAAPVVAGGGFDPAATRALPARFDPAAFAGVRP